MTDRTEGLVEKIQTSFGPLHVCVGWDGCGFDSVALKHNDRLASSEVGRLLEQIQDTVNNMLKAARP